MFIKKFFAVLTFILISISSAHADYLTDLCDDLYAKIEDQNTGSGITKRFYAQKVLPEVVSVVEKQIAAEVAEFYSTGEGSAIRSSRMSEEQKFDTYLQHKASVNKAKKAAWSSVRKKKVDANGNVVTVEKVYPKPGVKIVPGILDDPNNLVVVQEPVVVSKIKEMSEGQKLKALLVAHYRYSRQQAAIVVVSGEAAEAKESFSQYQNQLFKFVFPGIINSFSQGSGILSYIFN